MADPTPPPRHNLEPAGAARNARPSRGPGPRRMLPFGMTRFGLPKLFQGYLFLGVAGIVLAVFVFTNILVARLASQVQSTSEVFARFCATASFPASTDTTLQAIVGEVIQGLNFPIVLTDPQGIPRAWKGVSVHPDEVNDDSLAAYAVGIPVGAEIVRKIEIIKADVERMDRRHAPIAMRTPGGGEPLGQVHWGDPPGLEQLRWLPYVELVVMLLFVGLAAWGARSIKLSEQRSIWVGLARETAHQLGTPISSLLGWIELLSERIKEQPGASVTFPRQELEQMASEMENDAGRLNKVAARFSHIGSIPNLTLMDVSPVVAEAVQYLRRRLPHLGRRIEIREVYGEVPPINASRQLLEWVVENLLVNAINAVDDKAGKIEVRLERKPESETVELTVEDNGRGMTPDEQARAFDPGYTTRSRGWGLGLALAKRIVEEYHGGKIFIRRSAPGEGSAFVIQFPT
ncbi:MAG: sensor histidine kinase [Candidatus Eiseniibacteriota bacterium]